MKLRNECVIGAPLEQTWATMLDLGRVAGALPGATVEPAGSDGVYRGSMKVKLGPVVTEYEGTARLEEIDEDEHVTSFVVQGRELRGQGTASATIRNRLAADADGTRVVVESELNVTGRPAQLGRGMMEDVAGRLIQDFAGRLERQVLEPSPAPAPEVAPPADPANGGGQMPPRATAPSPAPAEDVLDLGGAAWEPLLRRALPVAGVAALLLLVLTVLLGRRPRVIVLRHEDGR